jgi:Spy/CpxP family protein refolding chaperone
MKAAQNPIAWILAAVALSALTSWGVVNWSGRAISGTGSGHHHEHAEESGDDGFHDWLHRHLGLSPEQETALAPIEVAYAEARAELRGAVAEASRRLASALDRAEPDRAAVEAALGEIHAAQGELQRSAISHFLEMKEYLSEEQAAKLLLWTRESIAHEHPR